MQVRVNSKRYELVPKTSPEQRKKGLLGTKVLPKDGAILDFFVESKVTIHTDGMEYPIFVVFVDSKGYVTDTQKMEPGNLGYSARARYVLELAPSEETLIFPGDKVTVMQKASLSKKPEAPFKMQDGGKLQILGEGGEVKKEIDESTRIVSRKETKRMFDLATKPISRKSNLELGKFIVSVINGQDKRTPEYVSK